MQRRPLDLFVKGAIGRTPWKWCTLVHRLDAEWDPANAKTNLREHGVRFADAVTALEDASAISVRDEGEDEERWITIGMDSLARLLVVVCTWRDERIRLISARLATRMEARQYGEGNEERI
jgi:uncharacterized DUF497 family protein